MEMDGGPHKAFAHRAPAGGEEPPEDSADAGMEEADVIFARRGCCCFWVPGFGYGRSASAAGLGGGTWERIGDGGPPGAAADAAFPVEPWWRRALMKVREWSEIVAGPRWKTFIRRFNRNQRWGGGGGGGGLCGIGGGARSGKFQYDPLSYALNFDEGHGQDGDSDGDYGHRNFSARYVLPPSLAKTSMDPGGREAPPLFSTA